METAPPRLAPSGSGTAVAPPTAAVCRMRSAAQWSFLIVAVVRGLLLADYHVAVVVAAVWVITGPAAA
eukprot:6808304-Alexandrium_andersonii.AAC.1